MSEETRNAPEGWEGVPVGVEAAALAAAAVLAVALLAPWVGQETRFEDLALGEGVTSVYATGAGGEPIHCKALDDAERCLEAHGHRGRGPAVLWLGNSQLHSVTNWQEDAQPAPADLHARLRRSGLDLIAFSQPNATLEEHWILFSYLRARLDLRALVLPVVFDDLREGGIRPAVAPALADPATRAALARHPVGAALLARADEAGDAAPDLAALDDTVQEHVESALNGWLERHSTLWKARPEARGQLFRRLRHLRNAVFGIDAQSPRSIIPGRYRANLAAAEALLADAREAGISVLVYVVPLRDDHAVPYVAEEYERFRRELEALARSGGAAFADFGGLVPGRYWGRRSPTALGGGLEIDFMHFEREGHVLLAAAVADALERQGVNGR